MLVHCNICDGVGPLECVQWSRPLECLMIVWDSVNLYDGLRYCNNLCDGLCRSLCDIDLVRYIAYPR